MGRPAGSVSDTQPRRTEALGKGGLSMPRRITTHLIVLALCTIATALVARPAQAQQGYSGVWRTFGEMRVEVSEGRVTGTYTIGPKVLTSDPDRPGTLTGEIKERTVPPGVDMARFYVEADFLNDGCGDWSCRGSVQLDIKPSTPDEMQVEYVKDSSSSFTRVWARRVLGGGPGGGMDRPGTTPVADLPLGGRPPSPGGDIPLSSNRILVPGGDAGTNNNDAARIPYNCRIDGALARGDYDAYTFEHSGGTFRASSEGNLDLVADLIRASDGETLARSGVDTPQFNIEGDLDAGRYILTLRVMHHAGAGPYGVILGNPGSCIVEETATASSEPVAPGPGAADQENLALNKATSQSSVGPWSRSQDPAVDSQGAVDGSTSPWGFHTNEEENPWWQVDLGQLSAIDEIGVFNRSDGYQDRARTVRVLLSSNGNDWQQIYAHDGTAFDALTIPVNDRQARFVRLQLNERQWFHLGEVTVLGVPVTAGQPTPLSSVPTPNPTLGLQLEPATGAYANIGMRVVAVDPDGNAARAGVRPDDVILSIDRQPLRNASATQAIVLSPGRELDVVAVRDGRIWTTSIGAPIETTDPVREGLGNLFDRLLQR
jgi:hypothetical protein